MLLVGVFSGIEDGEGVDFGGERTPVAIVRVCEGCGCWERCSGLER